MKQLLAITWRYTNLIKVKKTIPYNNIVTCFVGGTSIFCSNVVRDKTSQLYQQHTSAACWVPAGLNSDRKDQVVYK